jgi:NAD(P)-dependent dehydrogenase (short-subunit alcohol dehydrogenase family)
MQLDGKRVLITGAGSGIGRALAIEASHQGMTVALCGRRLEALDETRRLLKPAQHLLVDGDITDGNIRRDLRTYLWRTWGGLDVLINNAGIVAVGPLSRTTDEDLERMLMTNLMAPAALIREMLPLLQKARPSRIVNVGSVFGDIAYPLFGVYSATKFGLRGLSNALRRELKDRGIGITYAAPRATKTEAASLFGELIEPMQMKLDAPSKVASEIWRAVARDADTAYARGPERLFVMVERLFPFLVDRTIAHQMSDQRVQEFLGEAGIEGR